MFYFFPSKRLYINTDHVVSVKYERLTNTHVDPEDGEKVFGHPFHAAITLLSQDITIVSRNEGSEILAATKSDVIQVEGIEAEGFIEAINRNSYRG
jgi:hypothetical protein